MNRTDACHKIESSGMSWGTNGGQVDPLLLFWRDSKSPCIYVSDKTAVSHRSSCTCNSQCPQSLLESSFTIWDAQDSEACSKELSDGPYRTGIPVQPWPHSDDIPHYDTFIHTGATDMEGISHRYLSDRLVSYRYILFFLYQAKLLFLFDRKDRSEREQESSGKVGTNPRGTLSSRSVCHSPIACCKCCYIQTFCCHIWPSVPLSHRSTSWEYQLNTWCTLLDDTVTHTHV